MGLVPFLVLAAVILALCPGLAQAAAPTPPLPPCWTGSLPNELQRVELGSHPPRFKLSVADAVRLARGPVKVARALAGRGNVTTVAYTLGDRLWEVRFCTPP